VVIIGSGIVGSSTAYHLAQLGWRDILVIDQGDPVENDGSTSHAPGGIVGLSSNKTLTQYAQYGLGLYRSLGDYQSDRITFNPVGTMEIAVSQVRFDDLCRLQGAGTSYGVESHLLSPAESGEVLPYLDPAAIEGSLLVPTSSIVCSPHLNGAMQVAAAGSGAVRFIGDTKVVDIEIANGRIAAVVTEGGERIACEQVLIATNIWGPVLGDLVGVPVPLMALEHQYLISTPLEVLARFDRTKKEDEIVYPSFRDLDTTLYARQVWDSLGLGSYRHTPRPVDPHTLGKTATHEFTPGDFLGPAWEQLQRLVPPLRGLDPLSFPHRINGMFAFSVDGMPIIGPGATEGLWVAAASWLTHGAGVAKTVAEWMVTGDTEWDVRQVNVARFHGYQTTPRYIRTVCAKNYAEVYDLVHPRQPMTRPRNIRLSPFAARHDALGAVYTTFAGLELPNWFESNGNRLDEFSDRIPTREGWEATFWSRLQGVEHLATREGVGLFDLTGLSIIEVAGVGAATLVDLLCSNRIPNEGKVVYTTWLNDAGGVRRDLTVARLETDRFWFFVGEGTRPQDLAWVRRVARQSGMSEVSITDLSDSLTALGVWGPAARTVLSRVTTAALDNEAFPYFTCQWIDVGYAPALAVRISYAGELGWELHFPNEFALPVWDALWEAGKESSLVAGGMGAFDSLRLEKGYRGWGTDVHTDYNAFQAGLGWTVKLDKGEFMGAEAARRQATQPLSQKLCCLTMEERSGMAFGYEPIMSGDACVGHVTSANFGYSVGKFMVYGYLPAELAVEGTRLEVVYMVRRQPAAVDADPLFDPKMERLRS